MWLYIMSSLDGQLVDRTPDVICGSSGEDTSGCSGCWMLEPIIIGTCHDQLHVMADSPMELLMTQPGGNPIQVYTCTYMHTHTHKHMGRRSWPSHGPPHYDRKPIILRIV